jgi:hypothetical protein
MEWSEIKNDGLRSCPVVYVGPSGREFKFNVVYRPEGITPDVMIAFDNLDKAYKENEQAKLDNRDSALKVDLTATSRILGELITETGQTVGGQPIPSSEAFYLKTSYQYQSAIIKAVMDHYANPTSATEGSSSSLPGTSIAEPNTGESQSATS